MIFWSDFEGVNFHEYCKEICKLLILCNNGPEITGEKSGYEF